MCGGGGDSGAAQRAAEAERKKLEAERALEEEKARQKALEEKRMQAEREANARANRQLLTARAGSDEEDQPVKKVLLGE